MKDAKTIGRELYDACNAFKDDSTQWLGITIAIQSAQDEIERLQAALKGIATNRLTSTTSGNPSYVAGVKAGLAMAADMATRALNQDSPERKPQSPQTASPPSGAPDCSAAPGYADNQGDEP